MSRQRRSQPNQDGYRLPAAQPGRPDFFLVRGRRYVYLVPASSRGAWFLRASPLAEPAGLIPRIGPARLLHPELARAVLPLLAEHFRLRFCSHTPSPSRSSTHDHLKHANPS